LRNNRKSSIERLYKTPKSPENTPKKRRYTSYLVGARFLHLAFQGKAVRTPATRQLCHWSGAFQTLKATTSFDRVTRNNQYDSANAGRSQLALSVSTTELACSLTNRDIEIHGNSLEDFSLSPRKLNKTNFRE